MRLFLRLSFILSSIFVANLAFAATEAEMAEKGCDCLKEPYKKMAEMTPLVQEAMKTQDMSKIMELQGAMGEMMGSTEACFDELDKEYPEVRNNPELQDRISKLMDEEKCPRPNMGFQMPGQS